MNKTPAYVTISWVFLILIGIVLCYSYFFYPNSHPLTCIVKQYTGKDCPACGFSRAFSCYTHFKFQEGKSFNAHSWAVFLFFLFQLLVRAAVITYYYATKKIPSSALVKADIIISISAFLLAFLPLIL